MYLIVLFCILFKYHFNEAAILNATVKYTTNHTLQEGDKEIQLRINDISPNIKGACSGSCKINQQETISIFLCSVDDNGPPHLNVHINKTVTTSLHGEWICTFHGINDTDPKNLEKAVFKVYVTPETPPEAIIDKKYIIKTHEEFMRFNIIRNGDDFTLKEGETTLELGIKSGMNKEMSAGCTGRCSVNNLNLISTNCESKLNADQTYNVTVTLPSFKVTHDHDGYWECAVTSPNVTINLTIKVEVKGPDTKPPDTFNWTWVGVASGVVLVVLIIIGQTVCILHFKAKARKAQIDKNLTRKTSSNDNLSGRYESRPKRSVPKDVRESNIYEALDTIKLDASPPVPPPIETLPRTPKLSHMTKSASQSTLALKSDEQSRTTPRQPKKQSSQNKLHTVARSSSLERIKHRPPMDLPVADEIYEVMQQSDSETLSSSRFNLAAERSLVNNGGFRLPEPKPFKLPMPSNSQRSLAFNPRPGLACANQRIPSPNPQWTPNLDQRNPNQCSPKVRVARCPVRMADNSDTNRDTRGPPMGPSGRQFSPSGPRPPMGAMPVLPSMISPANLRPVRNKMATSPYDNRTPPAQSSSNPASKFRPPPPCKPKTTIPVENDNEGYSEQKRNQMVYSPYDNRMAPAQSINNLASKSRPPPASKPRPTMAPGNVNEGYLEHRIHQMGTAPYDNKMAPAQSFSNLASISRPQIHQVAASPYDNRMAPAQSFSNLVSMPRPPPASNQRQIENECDDYQVSCDSPPMPEDYYGSDDDEWTYEPLPQYNINNFGQPTKHF